MVQWLRIRLAMQGTWVRSLVQEGSTGRRVTEPMCYNETPSCHNETPSCHNKNLAHPNKQINKNKVTLKKKKSYLIICIQYLYHLTR